MRLIARVLIGLLSVSLLLSCSSGGAGRNEGSDLEKGNTVLRFSFWGEQNETDALDKLIADFEKAHPDIKIEKELTSWGDYQQKMTVQFAGGSAPDVLIMNSEAALDFMEAGSLLGLNDLIRDDPDFSLDGFFKPLLNHFSYDGELYVLPRDIDVQSTLFYNKRLFDEAGIPYPNDDMTWDDLRKAADKLTRDLDGNGMPDVWGVDLWGSYQALIYSNGGGLVDNAGNPGKCAFNEPKAVEAFQFYQDLVYKYKVHSTVTNKQDLGIQTDELFIQGKLGMFFAGVWMSPKFTREIDSFDWDVFQIPRGPSGQRRFVTEGSGYAINAKTEHPREAYEFVKLIGGPAGQELLAQIGLAQPAIRSLAESELFLTEDKPQNKKAYVIDPEETMFRPHSSKWNEIQASYLQPAFESILMNDSGERKTPEEALNTAAKRADRKVFNLR
jgi:ABC-type glycerol-3-phosphate transport system substrate-binding protein